MIWDLQIDRGCTALSVWTRSRGAYVWPLPSSAAREARPDDHFAPIGDHVYGDPDFDVAALASSGVAVTFAATGKCTISGQTVHIIGAGSCTVTASAGGNLDYTAAEDVAQTFTIDKAEQTISLASATPKRFGDDDFQVEATASSGLPVSLAVDGRCTISASGSPATVHITGGGVCTVTATQGGDDNWKSAPDEVREFDIAKADQTVAFDDLADMTYGDADVSLDATATSGLDVTFSAAGGCEVDGTTLKISGAGDCTVTASQAGDDDWNPAPDVSHTFSVAKAAQTVTFASLDDRTFGDADFALGGTASSGLDVAYAAAGNCSVSGATVHLTGAGSCTITASQPGNENYKAADSVDQTFAIAQQPQTISFAAIGDITLGDADVTVSPTVDTGLDVYLVSNGPCTIDSATAPAHVHATGAGTCTITASQPGDADRAPAPQVARSFAIAKAGQTITFPAIANRVFGGPFAVDAQSSSGLVVSLAASGACQVSGSTVTPTDAGTCTLVATQAGNTNYRPAASVTRSFAITNSIAGTAAGAAVKPVSGGLTVFLVDANLPGAKTLGGTLIFDATFGVFHRAVPAAHFRSKAITAFGIAPDGHSAWFAGTGTDGSHFTAYAADLTVRPKPHQTTDVFQLWIDGVLQTGDGNLDKGNVIITTR